MDSGQKPSLCALHHDYVLAVEKAGGMPVAVPYCLGSSLIGELLDGLDGVLFTGGDDLDPALYGESWHPKAEPVDPRRQAFELELVKEVDRRGLPAVGICLGSQVMNVHRGGTLIQFLPEHPRENPMEHRRLDLPIRRHLVELVSDCPLARRIGRSVIEVNTSHKQAIREVGRGLRVSAMSPDGIIEGVEDPTRPLYLAVQWHPERLIAEREHLAVFEILVEKAATTATAGRGRDGRPR